MTQKFPIARNWPLLNNYRFVSNPAKACEIPHFHAFSLIVLEQGNKAKNSVFSLLN